MKHPKQGKRAPPTHPSALAVPSYHRILVKHGLIEKTLPSLMRMKCFLKVGADPEVTECLVDNLGKKRGSRSEARDYG